MPTAKHKWWKWKQNLIETNVWLKWFFNVNVRHQFDANSLTSSWCRQLMSQKLSFFDLWLMVSWHQLLTSIWCQFNIFCPLGYIVLTLYTKCRHKLQIVNIEQAYSNKNNHILCVLMNQKIIVTVIKYKRQYVK